MTRRPKKKLATTLKDHVRELHFAVRKAYAHLNDIAAVVKVNVEHIAVIEKVLEEAGLNVIPDAPEENTDPDDGERGADHAGGGIGDNTGPDDADGPPAADP